MTFFFDTVYNKTEMGNQTSRRPIELGAYVTNAKAEVSPTARGGASPGHRSLDRTAAAGQRRQSGGPPPTLEACTGTQRRWFMYDAGLRSWCEVKLSRPYSPGAVLSIQAVQQHLDGPAHEKRYDPVLSQAERHNMQASVTSWRPCYSRRNRLFWTWTCPTRRCSTFGPTKAPPRYRAPPTRFLGRS